MTPVTFHSGIPREHKVQLEIVAHQVYKDQPGQEMQREKLEPMDRVEMMAILELLAHQDHRCAYIPCLIVL